MDHGFSKNPEEMPCVLELEREDMRVKVYEDSDQPGPVGYHIDVHSHSDLRNERLLTARLGDFDVQTVVLLLLEASQELNRIRGAGSRLPREE